MKFNLSKPILIILGTSLLLAMLVLFNRIHTEFINNKIEPVIDYDDVLTLQYITGENRRQILARFKDTGVTSVALSEDTLSKLMRSGKTTVMTGEEILNNARIGQAPGFLIARLVSSALIIPGRYYVIIDENQIFDRVNNSLTNELGSEIVKVIGKNVLEIKGKPTNLFDIGLGLPEEELEIFYSLGLSIIPRIMSSQKLDKVSIAMKLEKVQKLTSPKTIIFGGNEIIGSAENIDTVIEKLSTYTTNFGFIEFYEQKGALGIARSLPKQTVGVHTIPLNQLEKITPQIAIDRFMLAVSERGMRILYIHPYLNNDVNILEMNSSYLQSLMRSLNDKRYTVGVIEKNIFAEYRETNPLLLFIISLGIAAIGYLFLSLFLKTKENLTYTLMVGLTIMFLFFLKDHNLIMYRNICAFLVTVMTPVIAFVYCIPNDFTLGQLPLKQKTQAIALIVGKLFGIILLGGILISGLLSDPNYMLKIQQFMGVKISLILPPLIIAFYYFFYPDNIHAFRFLLKRFLDSEMTFKYLLLFGTMGLLFFVYITRSGNISIPLLNLEINMRQLLMKLFIVRPRTKEFLIGYPILMMTLYYLGSYVTSRYRWVLFTLAAIAPVSMLNTFCHIHSPFLISLWRSINGVILGAIITVLFILLIEAARKISRFLILG